MARWRRRRKPDDKVVTHPIFSYTLKKKTLKVRESSATKHGCSVEEILYAATHALVDVEENEDPPKRLLLGFDSQGRLLELVAEDMSEGYMIIHAMKCRPLYYGLLTETG